MKVIIDTELKSLSLEEGGKSINYDLYSREAFEIISQQWVKVGWNQKYSYTLSWMGRPIIQLPEDMVRMQEVIYRVKPDIIIETGIAHGGSLIFYASLCKAFNKGRVMGIDIEIRKNNRTAIEQHELSSYITLVEGDSVAQKTIQQVKNYIKSGERVMVILDSYHSKQHVLNELEAYSSFVAPDSYIVATDGIMKDLHDVPRGNPEWLYDNPAAAASEFAENHPEFVLEKPCWVFNESNLVQNITHWPDAWLRRIK